MINIDEKLHIIESNIKEIEIALKKDKEDGYLLRAYVRNRLYMELESLLKEYNSILYGTEDV